MAEAMLILRDPELRKLVADEVKHVVARATLRGAQALKENDFLERVESTLHRVNRFLSTQLLRATLCQHGKSLDLSEVLDKGQILLANLSVEGTKIADEDAAALGSVLLTDLWTAARRRGKREEGELRPCYLYIDEFQNFITPTIAKGLSEASGLGLHLTLAHQFPSQLTGHSKDFGAMVLDAVLAIAKNKLVFQLSHSMDLQSLASILYRQQIDPNQVKDEVWGTKVVGHEIRYLTSHSTTESQSTEHGWQRGRSDSTGRTGGTSVSRSRGVNDTHTVSDGTSDSHNASFSTNESVNEGWSDSHSSSHGESESSSTSRTTDEQETWGSSSGRNDSTSTGTNQGRSQSLSFGPQHKEFQRELDDYLAGKLDPKERAAFERKWPNAYQLTDSQGTSASESHGTNQSTSAGGGRSSSEGHSDSRGTSHEESVSHGRSGGRSTGQSRSSGSESGRSHSDGMSRGRSSSTQDGTNEGWSAQSSESFGESGSESETVSHGETVSPMLFPVYGKELSSRQFASVEEQVFGFMRFLDGQPDRHCVARLASMGSPAQIQTRTVTDPLTTAKWSRRWAERTLSKLPFVKRMDEALKELAEREANVVNAVRKTAAAAEPENYRRRVGSARRKPPSPYDGDNKE